jgi:hypothetical protein
VSPLTQQSPRRALPSGWPVRRTPRWLLLAIAAVVAITVVLSLVHKPSQAEQASDMRGFLRDVTTDIESCAGGVGESLAALRLVEAGQDSSTDVSEAISVAQQGAANCAPANNEQLDDLTNYQVTQSLASFGLPAAVTAMMTWAAPDAENVQTDVASALSAATPQAKSQAEAKLTRDLAILTAQRARVDGPITAAIRSLAMHASPPTLPG